MEKTIFCKKKNCKKDHLEKMVLDFINNKKRTLGSFLDGSFEEKSFFKRKEKNVKKIYYCVKWTTYFYYNKIYVI